MWKKKTKMTLNERGFRGVPEPANRRASIVSLNAQIDPELVLLHLGEYLSFRL